MSSKFILKRTDDAIGLWLANTTAQGYQCWTNRAYEARVFDRRNDSAIYLKDTIEKRFNCKVQVEEVL